MAMVRLDGDGGEGRTGWGRMRMKGSRGRKRMVS